MSLFANIGANKPATPSLFGNTPSTTNNSTTPGLTGSLFGNTQPAAATSNNTGPSLFGNLGAKPTTAGGLFANTAGTTQPATNATTPSLFGNINRNTTTNTPAPSGGLFGNSTTTAPVQSGGLFGGLYAQKPQTITAAQPTQSSGLFSNPATSNNTSLFGNNNNATQAIQTGSLFGNVSNNNNNNTQTSQTSQTGGLFGASTINPQQPQQNTAQIQTQTQIVKSESRQPAYFDQLLERGRKRKDNPSNSSGDLPSLQLGLSDIARKVRTLGQGAPQTRDAKSHYLLAASGVDTGTALKDLQSLGAEVGIKTASSTAPTFDTDLESYVDSLYDHSSLDLVEQALSQAKKDFDDFLEEHVQMEWDAQRRRIYEHFGLIGKNDDSVEAGISQIGSVGARGGFGRSSRRSKLGVSSSALRTSGMSRSVLGDPSMRGSKIAAFNDVAEKAAAANLQPVQDDRTSRDKQDKYAEKVKNLNVARLEEKLYPIIHQFTEIEAQPSNEDTSHYVNSFKVLAEIVGESSTTLNPSEPNAVKERCFAKDYLDDSNASKRTFELGKKILNGSRGFLEKQFLSHVETTVAKNPREANLGGVPTIINKVRGFIRIKDGRKELGADNVELQMLGEDYVWVLIFYLLRAGLVSAAATYVSENERAIKSMDRNFPLYLASFASSPERRLSPELQSRISAEYAQRSRIAPEHSLDPYRMACFKIIGRCGLAKRNLEGVNQGLEDWVWLQFVLAREVNRVEETAAEVFGLEEVRSVIHEVGQRHFVQTSEGASSFGTYFFLQILAGQFEAAIAWLYPHNYVTAVHFAIALDYYGLLRVNDFNGSDDLLSYTTRQQAQIAFGHMMGYYTKDFRAANPTSAADYLTLICLDGDVGGEQGKRQTQLCHEALRELVLETREFAQLLGDVRSDGQRIKGAIEQRLRLIRIDDEKQFLRQITLAAAQIADENGRVTDAVLLYHLAEEYDDVIAVCCRALSDAIALNPGDAPSRLEPLKPRPTNQNNSKEQSNNQAQQQDRSSLSLTSVADPYELASNMNSLYRSSALIYQRIRPANRGQIELLLLISRARSLQDQKKWAQCLDVITTINILPLSASGSMSAIRDRAASFNSLPPLVAKLAGDLLIWTIRSVGGQKAVLESEGWGPERKDVLDRLASVAKDCMVFAGLVRYRLGPQVWEVLAGGGSGNEI